MPTRANDHVAVRVSDVARATRFYVEAFDAKVLSDPFPVEGELAEAMFEGPPGIRARMGQMGFAGGGVVELFEFVEPATATGGEHASRRGIMHLGFEVDEVDETVARVERAGGRLIMPVISWGEKRLTFCADPDGNVIELADASIDELIEATHEDFPESRPS